MSTPQVVPAVDADIVARLLKLPTGVVCDALGRLGLSGFMDGISPLRRDAKMVGRARTLQYGPRRGAEKADVNVYAFMRSLEPGDVLVLGTGGCDGWIYGENVAHAAMGEKLGGIITDARARDALQLEVLPIPCFSRGVAVRPPGTIEPIATDVSLICAGAQVRPGDLLVGDLDGVMVVPSGRAADVCLQAEDLDMLEQLQEKAIAERQPIPELMKVLARKKVVKTA